MTVNQLGREADRSEDWNGGHSGVWRWRQPWEAGSRFGLCPGAGPPLWRGGERRAHWGQTLGGLWLTLQYHCRLNKIGHALVKVRLNDLLEDIYEIYMEWGKKGYRIMHIQFYGAYVISWLNYFYIILGTTLNYPKEATCWFLTSVNSFYVKHSTFFFFLHDLCFFLCFDVTGNILGGFVCLFLFCMWLYEKMFLGCQTDFIKYRLVKGFDQSCSVQSTTSLKELHTIVCLLDLSKKETNFAMYRTSGVMT